MSCLPQNGIWTETASFEYKILKVMNALDTMKNTPEKLVTL